MNIRIFSRTLALASLLLAWLPGLTRSSTAATLTDFGYNHMQLNGREARGGRPLLLILVDYETGNPLAHSRDFYDQWVFNVFSTNSLNGFFLENSNGRFYWTRAGAGTIGPLHLTSLERGSNWQAIAKANSIADVHWPETAWFSNIVAKAILSGFDFAPFDTDGDKVIRDGELGILIMQNDGENSGLNRWTMHVKVPGYPIEVEVGRAAGVDHNGYLNVLVHETSHCLGTVDLYGSANLSANLSIMAGAIDGSHIYHMDPWHKMQLGWSEPRIRSLRAGGVAELPSTQAIQADAPVLLYDPVTYDPTHETNEFFLLEYRTPGTGSSSSYDRNVAGQGLVIWHVIQNQFKDAFTIRSLNFGPIEGQPHWRWCPKCQGLVYGGGTSPPAPCPQDGGNHDLAGWDYQVVNNDPAGGEQNWRWCYKCQGLFFGDNESSSRCPKDGLTHAHSFSANYSLVKNTPGAPGQHEWRLCRKCQVLFYGPLQAQSDCPVSGQHDGSSSGDYAVTVYSFDNSVFALGAPDLNRGGNVVWAGGVTTPHLRWLDGTEIPVKIDVHPFNTGDGSITVEWLAGYDTWVDFNYPGGFLFGETGTFDQPYNTFAEGTAAVSHGGNLKIKMGTSAETGTVAKRMTIQAWGGPVTLGR